MHRFYPPDGDPGCSRRRAGRVSGAGGFKSPHVHRVISQSQMSYFPLKDILMLRREDRYETVVPKGESGCRFPNPEPKHVSAPVD